MFCEQKRSEKAIISACSRCVCLGKALQTFEMPFAFWNIDRILISRVPMFGLTWSESKSNPGTKMLVYKSRTSKVWFRFEFSPLFETSRYTMPKRHSISNCDDADHHICFGGNGHQPYSFSRRRMAEAWLMLWPSTPPWPAVAVDSNWAAVERNGVDSLDNCSFMNKWENMEKMEKTVEAMDPIFTIVLGDEEGKTATRQGHIWLPGRLESKIAWTFGHVFWNMVKNTKSFNIFLF